MSMSMGYSPSSSPPVEKFTFYCTYSSKRANGTVTHLVDKVEVAAAEAIEARKRYDDLVEKLKIKGGKDVKFIDIQNLIVTYADGKKADMKELLDSDDEDVTAFRAAYQTAIKMTELPVIEGRGIKNGPKCLESSSERVKRIKGWDTGKDTVTTILSKLGLSGFQETRGRKIENFRTQMIKEIETRLKDGSLTEEKRKQFLQLLKFFSECDRFALIAHASQADRTDLLRALRSEHGELKEGLLGKFGRTNDDPTSSELNYLDDIELLGMKRAEFITESHERGRQVTQDCFERLLVQAFDAAIDFDRADVPIDKKIDGIKKAARDFCFDPLITGLRIDGKSLDKEVFEEFQVMVDQALFNMKE